MNDLILLMKKLKLREFEVTEFIKVIFLLKAESRIKFTTSLSLSRLFPKRMLPAIMHNFVHYKKRLNVSVTFHMNFKHEAQALKKILAMGCL